MKVYHSKLAKLSGTDYAELYPKAYDIYKQIKRKSKRRPSIRSAYFNKAKIFLDYFWEHLHQKNASDRARRLKFYACAIDLVRNAKVEPLIERNPFKSNELLYRFAGLTKDNELFYVQIKESIKNDQKFLMSIFPQ